MALIVCGAGWTAISMVPDKYESKARVYLDTQSMLKPVLRGLVIDSDVRSSVAETTRRTLLRRSNLEQLIRDVDMDLAINSPQQKERLIRELSQNIKVSGGGRNNIYTISYQNKNAVLTERVVAKALDIFVETALGVVRKDSSMTEGFINDQISGYEERLTAAEELLKEFKRENIGFMPTEAGGYFQRLSRAGEELKGVQLEYSEAENRRNVLASQMEGERPFMSGVVNQDNVDRLDARIHSMLEKLDTLLLQFTDNHPDVIAIRQSITDLEVKKESKQGENSHASESENSIKFLSSPVYQELKVAFAKAAANLAALHERRRIHEGRVAELGGYIDKILEVEAELARLNRDYEINKKNYGIFVSRRESAKITRDADQSVDNIQFKIIDHPTVALFPVSPNRPMLVTLVLLLGLGAGTGLAWLVSMARPTFDEPNEIRKALGLPVLGGVSRLFTDKAKKRKRMELTCFIAMVLLLFVVYSFIIIIEKFGINIFELI
ncbi:MAG: chain-length determining protein [Gammaproteobacteria bacterium]|nr:chain-length determining protein [Gammaproteobacteria bacterium]